MNRPSPRAVSMYRALLRLYPKRFRESFGEEMEQAFAARYGRGRTAWSFWLDTTHDVLWNALAVRLRLNRLRAFTFRLPRLRRIEMAAIWQDIRYAARTLVRQPLFSLIVVVTLGLGIGATTAIFTIVHGVLLAPLPFADAHQLVRVWENDTNEGRARGNLSPADFRDYRERNTTLVGLAGFTNISTTWTEGTDAERLRAQLFTPNMFEILGIPPMLGRTFASGDELEETPRVVLSYGFWQSKLAGDSSVVGNTVPLGQDAVEVIGVMPPTFRTPNGQRVELWAPWDLQGDDRRAVHFIRVVARTQPDVSVDAARAELLQISRDLEREYPDINTGHLTTVERVSDALLGDVRVGLWLLMAAVIAVMLIACANLANLFLSRGIARGRELALRTALGAGRRRLFAQLLTESALLAAVGGAFGVLLANMAVNAFIAMDPGTLPRLDQVSVNAQVGVFVLAALIATTMVFGGVPALLSTRQHPADALRAGGGGARSGGMRQGLRGALVVFQLTLAIVLLLGAGLLLRSFDHLVRVDPGFEAETVLTALVELEGPRYDDRESIVRFQSDLRERLEGDPIIRRVGTVTFLPFTGNAVTAWLNILGRPPWDGVPPEVNLINVSGDYFGAIGLRVVAGRTFDERDHIDSPRTVVVNESLARTYFENENPIGAMIRLGPNPEAVPFTIIGVVSDMRQYTLDRDAFPAAFNLSSHTAWSTFHVVMRTTGDPQLAAQPFRQHLANLDPELVTFDVQSMSARISDSLARPRFSLVLLGLFAAAALTLAAVGVYGVVAYSVAVRSHELGIRMALGASKTGVISLVLRQAVRLAMIAITLGLAAGAVGSRVLQSMLFEIHPVDPITFFAMPAVLLVVAILAAYQPAQRAVRLDPVRALKAD